MQRGLKSESKQLVLDLSEMVKSFSAGTISANEAWNQLQTLTDRLRTLTAEAKNDGPVKEYLAKANSFREKAALQILERKRKEDQKIMLDDAEKKLTDLMAVAETQPVQKSVEALQDVTRLLQMIDVESFPECSEKMRELDFMRQEMASRIFEMNKKASK